ELLGTTMGVPCFFETLTGTCLPLDVLHPHNADHRATRHVDEVDVPDTIEALVTGRLERLGDGARRTLQLASVIGPRFPKRLLETAADLPAQLDAVVTELTRVELLYEPAALREPSLVFKHALIR